VPKPTRILVGVLVVALSACLPAEELAPAEPTVGEPEPLINAGRVPLPEASKAEVCADDGLALTRWDLATFHRRFSEVCCGSDGLPPDHARCVTPPLGDLPTCLRLQELRYLIVARYGQVFEDEALKKHFEAQPWYVPDPSFHINDLTVTGKRNVISLQNLVQNGEGCTR